MTKQVQPTAPMTPPRAYTPRRQAVSPATYSLAFVAPAEALLAESKQLNKIAPNLATKVLDELKLIYYQLFVRTTQHTSVSIIAALIIERVDRVRIGGARHDLKAAGFANRLDSTLTALNDYLRIEGNPENKQVLQMFINYLELHKNTILRELKKLPEAQRAEVSAQLKPKLKPCLLKSPKKKAEQQALVEKYHQEELLKTPTKITPRSAQLRRKWHELQQEIAQDDYSENTPPPAAAPAADASSPQKVEPVRTLKRRKLDFSSIPVTPVTASQPAPAAAALTPIADTSNRPLVKMEFKVKTPAPARLSELTGVFHKIAAVEKKAVPEEVKRRALQDIQSNLAKEAKAEGIETTLIV